MLWRAGVPCATLPGVRAPAARSPRVFAGLSSLPEIPHLVFLGMPLPRPAPLQWLHNSPESEQPKSSVSHCGNGHLKALTGQTQRLFLSVPGLIRAEHLSPPQQYTHGWVSPHPDLRPACQCIAGHLTVYKGQGHYHLNLVLGCQHGAHPHTACGTFGDYDN